MHAKILFLNVARMIAVNPKSRGRCVYVMSLSVCHDSPTKDPFSLFTIKQTPKREVKCWTAETKERDFPPLDHASLGTRQPRVTLWYINNTNDADVS